MTQQESTVVGLSLKALMAEDQDFMRQLVRAAMQEILEAEMTEALGAESGERTETRLGYWAGSCSPGRTADTPPTFPWPT